MDSGAVTAGLVELRFGRFANVGRLVGVADAQTTAADAAENEAGQQRPPLAGRPLVAKGGIMRTQVAFGRVGAGKAGGLPVVGQGLLVGQVLLPGDVGREVVVAEHLPFLGRQATAINCSWLAGQVFPLPFAVGIGAGVEGQLENEVDLAVGRFAPKDGGLADGVARLAGQLQAVGNELAQDSASATGPTWCRRSSSRPAY
jgi:hypothetical protein